MTYRIDSLRGWVKISAGIAVGTVSRAYLWLDKF